MGVNGRSCLAIVLAAGEGTRMRSDVPKVLHKIAGREMLAYVLEAVCGAGADSIAVVVGPGRADVAEIAHKISPGAEIFTQNDRRGTADAVLAARSALARGFDDVLIAFADTPLVQAQSFLDLRAGVAQGAAAVVLGFEAEDPEGYGRLLRDGAGELTMIREHKDASTAERESRLCNAGLMALDGRRALELLDKIVPNNAQNELYLTDVVALARASGARAAYRIAREQEVMGVNDRAQLALAEGLAQKRLRAQAMRAGATLIAPETVFLSWDTRIGRDVTIEPHVVFGPGVRVGDGVLIHAFCHLEGATLDKGAVIGPFARLRPGAQLDAGAKIGNFVEIKAARIEAGAKVNHLSYIGDARVGAKANIGAGVVTCNYDGFEKFKTDIGAGAFIGTNSSLVAPVKIGDGAYIGTGSVIVADVPDDALALARARQIEKNGWAKDFRQKPRAKKGGA